MNRKTVMPSKLTRRDILKYSGGTLLGVMLSPLPWKLLDDSAIWTQNWSLTPKLSHGPLSSLVSRCTLCQAGCAVQADCVGGTPYRLAGIDGGLCAPGLAGHHLAHHPLRIVHPHLFSGRDDMSTMTAVPLNEAAAVISKRLALRIGSTAVLDHQPGRPVSEQYRTFLAAADGLYLVPSSREEETVARLRAMSSVPSHDYGFDLENSTLIVSFGAPLLDGWGVPSVMQSLRLNGAARFVQVDCRRSRTAAQAHEWLPVRPGTERLLALSMLNVLLHEGLVTAAVKRNVADLNDALRTTRPLTPEAAAPVTGIAAPVVRDLAVRLAASDGAVVLSGADAGGGPFDAETQKAVAAINVLIGAVGRRGGIVRRTTVPGIPAHAPAMTLAEAPDRSIGVLFVDGADSGYAVPWELIERKLQKDALVVSFSPVLNTVSAHADVLIPAPAPYEAAAGIPNGPGAPAASFAVSMPLLPKNEHTAEPSDVLRLLAAELGIAPEFPSSEDAAKRTAEAVYASKRGSVRTPDGSVTAVAEIGSAEELWTLFTGGARWTDEPERTGAMPRFTLGLTGTDAAAPTMQGLAMIANGWRGTVSASQISPVLSKVFQESELRHNAGTVLLNPLTASSFGLNAGDAATVSTDRGAMTVRVRTDAGVRPDTIEAVIGPLPNGAETPRHPSGRTMLDLCAVAADGTWRITPAFIQKA